MRARRGAREKGEGVLPPPSNDKNNLQSLNHTRSLTQLSLFLCQDSVILIMLNKEQQQWQWQHQHQRQPSKTNEGHRLQFQSQVCGIFHSTFCTWWALHFLISNWLHLWQIIWCRNRDNKALWLGYGSWPGSRLFAFVLAWHYHQALHYFLALLAASFLFKLKS